MTEGRNLKVPSTSQVHLGLGSRGDGRYVGSHKRATAHHDLKKMPSYKNESIIVIH
jgi:hypothetical protein